jgi:hypothetical protein
MHRRRIHALWKIPLAIAALLCALALLERFRGQISLATYRRELASKGEKVTPQDLIQVVPSPENGAVIFLAAARGITPGAVLPNSSSPKMRILASGRALVGYREPFWVDDKVTNRWEQVEQDLQANAEVLAQARAALELPRFNHNLDYAQGAELLLPHLALTKSISGWFGTEVQLAIRKDRALDARANLVAQTRLTRVMEEDRLLISELVRIAIAKICRTSVWEALQSEVLSAEDLEIIQQAWADLTFLPNMSRALEGERIFIDVSYDTLRKSNDKTADTFMMLFNLESSLLFPGEPSAWQQTFGALPYGEEIAGFLLRHVYTRVWRFAWSHQVQLASLRETQRLTEIARLGLKGKSYQSLRGEIAIVENESARKGLYDRIRFLFDNPFFTLSSSIRRAMEAETERSLVVTALALKRYFLARGHYPDNLASLVPTYFNAVPVDYMDGNSIRYRPIRGGEGFMLFSVGSDGVDDGGDGSLISGDSGVHAPWERKDVLWPQAALPEEVESFRSGE